MQRRKKKVKDKREKKARAIKWALGCVNEYPTARCINRTTQDTAKHLILATDTTVATRLSRGMLSLFIGWLMF